MKQTIAVVMASIMLAGGASFALADSERGEGYHGKHHREGHHEYGHHGSKRGCGSMERMTDALNLTDDQVKKMRAINDKYRPKKQALADKARENRRAMRALMDKDSVKESEIRKLADAYGKIKADKIVLKSKMKMETREVLTKEQQAKWKEMRESHRKYR
jgi:Spy/CpxP family protein refolding chaperone